MNRRRAGMEFESEPETTLAPAGIEPIISFLRDPSTTAAATASTRSSSRALREMAMAFGSSASKSAASGAFSSYDLGTSLGFRLVTVRGKRFVELEGVAFDSEVLLPADVVLLDSPRSRSGSPDYTPLTPSSQQPGSLDYSPATPEYTPLTPSLQRSGSLYSPATPEYTPLTPSSQLSGSPVYSPATPECTPLTPSSQRSGSRDYSQATPPLTPPKRSGSPAYTPATANYTPRTPSGCCLSDYFNNFDRYCISPSTGYSSRAPASPEYTPASPSGCCSPDYSALFDDINDFCYTSPPSAGYSLRAASPEDAPIPYYTPGSPSGLCSPDYAMLFDDINAFCYTSPPSSAGYPLLAASPEYTPAIPEYTPATPEYTPLAPLSPLRRASSPEYTPSSPLVSDAVSGTSPPSHRRHHPYQRSRTSCCERRPSSSKHIQYFVIEDNLG
ncbi:unnamed protein product [Miscanthus lutarioriparius]|uniref:Uncharacterized protein n=1 Tax=Miscanthus lutarioriparius TaxID=422564 RepID=A0A811QWQ9_9POAL|nr:unnamed protein product [Miscanthus lutarioriparius]